MDLSGRYSEVRLVDLAKSAVYTYEGPVISKSVSFSSGYLKNIINPRVGLQVGSGRFVDFYFRIFFAIQIKS